MPGPWVTGDMMATGAPLATHGEAARVPATTMAAVFQYQQAKTSPNQNRRVRIEPALKILRADAPRLEPSIRAHGCSVCNVFASVARRPRC